MTCAASSSCLRAVRSNAVKRAPTASAGWEVVVRTSLQLELPPLLQVLGTEADAIISGHHRRRGTQHGRRRNERLLVHQQRRRARKDPEHLVV